MFILERCKREDYIKAWNAMYKNDKKAWNTEMFDGVNPSLNKTPLGTEIDNFCTIIYDDSRKGEAGFEDFEYGVPVGIFSFVVTPRKIIGKQYVVHPDYQGKGLGKALLIENEKVLKENGYNKYYIGCSKYSAALIKKHWGIEPYASDVEGDLYKFNIDLDRENFDELYKSIITDNENLTVLKTFNVSIKTSVSVEPLVQVETQPTNKPVINNAINSNKKKNKKKKKKKK